MTTITKSNVDQLIPPVTGQKFLRDNKLRGFALRVTASGAKSFVYEGRIHGRVRRITIGPYPALNVAVARQAALRAGLPNTVALPEVASITPAST